MDCIFIIFGLTGDLCKRKLLPGLYKLIKDKKIQNYAVIGFGLEDLNVSLILESTKKFITDFDDHLFATFASKIFYQQGDATKLKDFENLKTLIIDIEKKLNLSGNRLAYCATPAHVFGAITTNLVVSGILHKQSLLSQPFNRIAFEKPFGFDFESAKKLNTEILALLDESQIYRIDHYLAKEFIESILYLRFTNRIFESIWNNQDIESIEINLMETICVDGRGKYFDMFGVLRDVVQNHMLQLLALVTMKDPKKLVADSIRNAKAELLKKTKFVDGFVAQYDGYLQEMEVKPDSKTETFAMLKLEIDNEEWHGVPIYLRSGKCLKEKTTSVVIKFKGVDCRLTAQNCPVQKNCLTLEFYPQGGFTFEFNAKKPGDKDEVMKFESSFCYDCMMPISPEAYENILLSIVNGDQSISVRFDEIEYCWKIIDDFRANIKDMHYYQKYSDGPENEITDFEKKHNFTWKN